MKAEITAASFAQIASSILEEAAFLFVMPVDSPPDFQESVVRSSIQVGDESASRLLIACDASLAREIAANLLGLDSSDGDTATQGPHALAEILNIVAGALMERWYGSEDPPAIGIPSTQEMDPGSHVRELSQAVFRAHLVTETMGRIDLVVFAGGK